MRIKSTLLLLVLISASLSGCKYYGSALPPEYPLSMDDSLAVANDKTSAGGATQRAVVRKIVRPRVERPSYIPEKELAVVAPPKTLLVWNYPHITEDNQRVFGSWSTIFLTERYEWVPPANEVPADDMIPAPPAPPTMAPLLPSSGSP
jgi:hypothetical protein